MSTKPAVTIRAIALDGIDVLEEGVAPVVTIMSTESPGPTSPPPPAPPDTTIKPA